MNRAPKEKLKEKNILCVANLTKLLIKYYWKHI